MHKSWVNFWEQNKDLYLSIMEEVKKTAFFPEEENILRFMDVNVASVNYVILGMDPYPSDYLDLDGNIRPVATGRSFEIGNVDSWQKKIRQNSIRNIMRAIVFDYTGQKVSMDEFRKLLMLGKYQVAAPHEWFDNMEKQGVMFLNSALTVIPGKPNSHMNLWKEFSKRVLCYITENSGAVFLAWGNTAYQTLMNAVPESKIEKYTHPRCERFVSEHCFQKADKVNWTGLEENL